ncbi:hypothetical protein MKK88_06655 [Methylobacterium sp. E-005]|uniref:hypothetical protein n=1 Tax=Methylobacterium sp. E-005 TaxID=2836549 RepID=UPI001FBBB78A|nr:hypothetical protein [Methylobacterium sp. E-005]MCJ2085676.1 hypothetical protein [Methylobacterium sp. E-005]
MSTTGPLVRSAPARFALRMPRRHRLMLLLAFEIMVLGFVQAMVQPVRRPGITIEMSVTPRHVVT